MNYQGTIIRPPSEANSIILQVTVGCSHNKCTFCGVYKGTLFAIKDRDILEADLAFAAQYCRRQTRVFLADGDALIIPFSRLKEIFVHIGQQLPWVKRISLYGNAKSIAMKSDEQLTELKELGLDRIYMGLESGHDEVLKTIRKGVDSRAMIDAAQKISRAGIFLSVTVLLGIAGEKLSGEHARATAAVLNAMQPNQIAALTLMLLENTPLYKDMQAGSFQVPSARILLEELREMIEHIRLDRVQFQSNHASNYLPINARLGRDKDKILTLIDEAIAGEVVLVPERYRAL